MDRSEEIVNRITRDGVLRFSELTHEERAILLASSKENMDLFELYVEFRRKIDNKIRDDVLNGADIDSSNLASYDHVSNALAELNADVDRMGAAAMNVLNSAQSHALLLAKRSARNVLGELAGGVPDELLEALLKGNRKI